MKNSLLTFIFLLCMWAVMVTPASAQISSAKNAVSYKIVGTDFKTPLLNNFYDSDNIDFGAEIAYSRFLNNSLNLNIPFRIALMDYPLSDVSFNPDRLATGLDFNLVYKFNNGYILKETANVAPYVLGGLGAAYTDAIPDNSWNIMAPIGGGINWHLTDNVAINTQVEYRVSLNNDYNNLTYSAGVFFLLGEVEDDKPVTIEPVDSDGDGVVDVSDDCPNTPGKAELNGCPDKDDDGIADKDDLCPDTAGLKEFDGCPDTDADGLADKDDDCPEEAGPLSNKGCPEKDTDGDGIIDDNDDCPDVAGVAACNGCPDTDGDGICDKDDDCPEAAGTAANNGCPDRDGDGVIDKDDRCPDEKGPVANKGCPEIKEEEKDILEFATRAVQFETGSATIRKSSYDILDQVAQILKDYPAYSCLIEGHTDNIGEEENNQTLSERRAKSCYDYLVNKGIAPSRMSHTGYGESQPIGDNRFKDGRAQNRRVEFNVFLK
ncbi:MAG: OmpA family protein [Bacteroidota bacterium]